MSITLDVICVCILASRIVVNSTTLVRLLVAIHSMHTTRE